MLQHLSQFDVQPVNVAQQCDCWHHHFLSLQSVTWGFCQFYQGCSIHAIQPYNIHVAHKRITTLIRRLLTQTRGQTGSNIQNQNVATAKLLTLVKLAETLAPKWLNTNERQEMVTPTITLLSTIYRQNINLTGTLWHVLHVCIFYLSHFI